MRHTIFSKNDSQLLRINDIGYAKTTDVTRFGPGQRDVYLIHYVISGKGCFNGNPVSAGQGFLITPGMLEEYYPDAADPWEFLWVISDDSKMDELLPYCHADVYTNIFNYEFVHIVRAVADTLIINTNARYHSLEVLEIFLSIFKHHLKENDLLEKKSYSDIYIEAAVNYINTNIYNPISVTELTGFLGVSQPYLYKIFKSRLGKSPKQYISDRKILRAKELLRETDLTVTQIAASVGFSDVLCFSKFFSHQTGVSPQKYRLNQTKGIKPGPLRG